MSDTSVWLCSTVQLCRLVSRWCPCRKALVSTLCHSYLLLEGR